MKPPFALPARFDGNFLVAADCELICKVEAPTRKERQYLLEAANNWPRAQRLIKLLDELLLCTELNYDDPHEEATTELLERIRKEKAA